MAKIKLRTRVRARGLAARRLKIRNNIILKG